MAYDSKNAYPKNAPGIERESAVDKVPDSKGPPEGLEARTLDKIRNTITDMSSLRSERAEFQNSYLSVKEDKLPKGRSHVTDTTSQDTVETVMPVLMSIFYGGKNVLEVEPRENEEDEFKAKYMEEKANFDIQKQNEGYKLIYQFLKDSLMFKMGVVKYHWLKKNKTKPFSAERLTHDELMGVLADEDFIVKESDIKPVGADGKTNDNVTHEQLMSSGDADFFTYDISGKQITKRISKPVLQNLPPEEFGFDIRARAIQEAFCYHQKKVHWKKLKKYGVTKEDVRAMKSKFDPEGTAAGTPSEVRARFEDLGGPGFISPKGEPHMVYIYESYIDDYDENGDPINMQVIMFGDKMLHHEKNSYKTPPFAVISPILVQHRMIGRGIIELTAEIQKLKTALIRYILDNIYFQNNGMRVINPFRIKLESMLSQNKPGGVVTTIDDINPSEAIYNIPMGQLPSFIMKMVEYIDGPMKGRRTGIVDFQQGLDSKSLNKTATGISIITSAAQKRIELMARNMAETGIKDLYNAVVQMNIDYFDREQNIKVGKKWTNIQPENIDAVFDVNIEVGSFSSNAEMAFQQLNMMLDRYMSLGAGITQATGDPSQVGQLFDIDNIKNILKQMWETLGFKETDQFMTKDTLKSEETEGGADVAGQIAGIAGLPSGAGGEGQAPSAGGAVASTEPNLNGLLQTVQGENI
jgi:hypothetical protein